MAKNSNAITTKKAQQASIPGAPDRKKRTIIVVIVSVVVLFIFNLITGLISYGAMTAWCGRLPITATEFAASYSYDRPGDPFYGPSPFAKYYCTEEDARNAGFNPGPW